jgi:hypothetical protein
VAFLRDATAAAARRNGKNGFHKMISFRRVNLRFFPLRLGTGRTMRPVG